MYPLIPVVAMMLAGTAIQYKAQQDAARRTREATNAAQMRQLLFRDKASDVINKALQTYENPNRIEKGITIEGEILDRSNQAMQHADEQGFGDVRPSIQGNVSGAYDKARADATVRRKADASDLARILAKVQAPGRMRNNENLLFGDTASQLGTLGNFARGTGQADGQLIQRASQPNAGAMLFGSLLTSAGSAGL